MSVPVGTRYGIRTLEDLRQRSVISPGCTCWKRPVTLVERKARGDDPTVWVAELQQALAMGSAVYFLQHGRRLRRGNVYARTCDTWGCANPEHRKVMTYATLCRKNSRPLSLERKLQIAATRRRNSRLSEDDITAIAESTEPARDVAARYGISKAYVYMLRRGEWRQKPTLLPAASVFAWRAAA